MKSDALRWSGFLGSVPLVGRGLRRLAPVADHRDRYRMLSDKRICEWALMHTHDGLITRYTFPQRWHDLARWTSGLEGLRWPSEQHLAAVARRPYEMGSMDAASRPGESRGMPCAS